MVTKENLKKMFLWVLTLGLPFLIWMIPLTDSYTADIKTFLVITVFAILALAVGTIPQNTVTFLLPVAYILIGIAPPDLAWLPWTLPVVWMIIGALLLVNVLETSGVLMRISYKVILLFGGTYKGLIIGIAVLGVLLNLILFGNAYVVLAGLAFGLCKALELPKFSKEACGIFLVSAIAGIIPGIFLYGANCLILEGIGASVIGQRHISYIDYTILNLPGVVYYILATLIILLMFRAGKELNGKAYFQGKLNELGKMTFAEKKATVWVILLISYVIGCGLKGADCTMGFIIMPALMTLPGIGCGNEEDISRLDFSFILFVASCMSIGFVAQSLGVGNLVSDLAAPYLENAGTNSVTLTIYVVNIILNFLLTPMAIWSGFTPTFLEITNLAGINPYVTYSMIMLGTDQILFPYEYALYMLYFSFGYIAMKDFVKYFGAKMLLCALLLPVLFFPYWHLTGLFLAK